MRLESSPTVGELLVQLADRVGLAAQSVDARSGLGLPSDPATVSRLQNALRVGAQALIRMGKWSWQVSRESIACDPSASSAVCHNGRADEYWVLSGNAVPLGKVIVKMSDGVGHPLDVVSEDLLEETRAYHPQATGLPSMVAFGMARPRSDGDRVRSLPIIKLFPSPGVECVVSWQADATHNTLAETTERPYWSAECDEAVLAGAVEHLVRSGIAQTKHDLEESKKYARLVREEAKTKDAKILTGQVGMLPPQYVASGRSFASPVSFVNEDGSPLTLD